MNRESPPFDPTRFGFQSIYNFPMVIADLSESLNPRRFGHTFIKVTALGGREFKPHETRLVFWYKLCDTLDADPNLNRIHVHSASYCSERFKREGPSGEKTYKWPTSVYFGPVGSDAFAELLLENLIGPKWREDHNAETLEKWERIKSGFSGQKVSIVRHASSC